MFLYLYCMQAILWFHYNKNPQLYYHFLSFWLQGQNSKIKKWRRKSQINWQYPKTCQTHGAEDDCCWHSCLEFCWFDEEWISWYGMRYLLLRKSFGVRATWMNASSFHGCHVQYFLKIPVKVVHFVLWFISFCVSIGSCYWLQTF